ncbi:MAG: hypothetical protein AMJ81_01865 [Phycisphaerae bacterium SM23_33]|nr:MAG: hypothetical protein AMJ81_01865 [Phycisphaerae bacterium SM23_33]
MQKTKQPVPWLTWGADARLREIFTPNLLLDREDRHFQRYRFRIWTTVTPVENLSFNARLVWEPRHFCQPSRTLNARNARIIDEWTVNEAIADQFNIEWKNIFGLPVTVKAGRQDIIFGNGWLVLDGTPLDGSRTIFFDAIRGTLDLKDINTTVDLIYICQQADSDQRLPPFCDKDFHNIEQDEQGVIVYVTNKSLDRTQIDGYFIYKHDEQDLGSEPGDIGPLAPWQVGTNADIFTFGARVAGDVGEHWKYRAEFAQEFGDKNGRDLCAFGFNSQVSYFLRDNWNNNFRVGYEYLSGENDPDSGSDSQFDPLWGRWPQWSELLAYTVALENRPGEQTNLHRVGVGWSCTPHEKLELCADYHLLFADKNTFRDRPFFTDHGCFKGQLLTGLLKYKFNKHIAGHVLAELFFPGDYYSDVRNEVAGMFRYEIVFTW